MSIVAKLVAVLNILAFTSFLIYNCGTNWLSFTKTYIRCYCAAVKMMYMESSICILRLVCTETA